MSKNDSEEIQQFLYYEAELLATRKYDAWLELFTDDSHYWVPAGSGDPNPEKETSLIYDNREGLKTRVVRLLDPTAHCQTPPSRTSSLISNVRIEEFENAEIQVHSNFALFESRLGVQQFFAGQLEHRLRRLNGTWRIAFKRVDLVNRDAVFSNLTFLF